MVDIYRPAKPDGIHLEIMKPLADTLGEALAKLLNTLLDKSTFVIMNMKNADPSV